VLFAFFVVGSKILGAIKASYAIEFTRDKNFEKYDLDIRAAFLKDKGSAKTPTGQHE
jgi:hypothetical protein